MFEWPTHFRVGWRSDSDSSQFENAHTNSSARNQPGPRSRFPFFILIVPFSFQEERELVVVVYLLNVFPPLYSIRPWFGPWITARNIIERHGTVFGTNPKVGPERKKEREKRGTEESGISNRDGFSSPSVPKKLSSSLPSRSNFLNCLGRVKPFHIRVRREEVPIWQCASNLGQSCQLE